MTRAVMLALLVFAPAQVGTASVSGLVTLGDEAQTPVRRAVVTMLSSGGNEARSTISDDEGRFAIGGLPAGRYTLQANKPAHLTMAYGARRPGRPGTALIVTAGQSIRDLRLPLPRGAALAGRVTFENGKPLANARVMAVPRRLSTTGGATTAPPEFETDDRGEFRIYGLLPDTYLLAAFLAVSRGQIQRRSDQEFDAIVRTLRQSTAVPASQTAGTGPPPPPAVIGYAPTYFPGTPIATDATPITVRAGEVKDGLDFTISMVPMASISGSVFGANGAPAPAVFVSAELVGSPALPALSWAPLSNRPGARGEFSVPGLRPGRYRIRAQSVGTTQTEWAVVDVSVSGADIAGLSLAMQPGHVFSGALSTESSAAPASWKGAIVAVQPTTADPGFARLGASLGVIVRQAPVSDDGRFTMGGIVSHDYEVRVTLPPALAGGGWTLGAIRHNARDLRDAPLTFAGGSVEGVQIVLTTAVTELAGRFTSESGAPATDYFIVAFPEDQSLWHPASPRVRVMRPAADGTFSTRDLPPGAYRLAALTDVEDDEPKRREFLESIYDTPVRVTVEAGKRAFQELRIK